MDKQSMRERVEVMVRNILSGNGCGALAAAVQAGDGEYFRRCLEPVAVAYEEEAGALRRQRDDALAVAEQRRRALEYLVGNLAIPEVMRPEVEPVLGRRLS